jgi:hypothetical protein
MPDEHAVTPFELFDLLPALAALGLVSAVCVLIVAYVAIGRRESRARIRASA